MFRFSAHGIYLVQIDRKDKKAATAVKQEMAINHVICIANTSRIDKLQELLTNKTYLFVCFLALLLSR